MQKKACPPQSMPPASTTIGALWHCLRPSFKRVWRNRPFLQPVTRKGLFGQRSKAPPKRDYTLACVVRDGRHWKLRHPHACQIARHYSVSIPGDPHELPGRLRLHDLTTEAAYEELRRASHTGNYLRVQALVRMLVRDRSEEPNPRLYLALLLANTSPQHGSPGEVAKILQEMGDEGLTPDSSIYHAVLRVG